MFDQILAIHSFVGDAMLRWNSPYYPKETLLYTTDSLHYSWILPTDTALAFLT
jgi:hypothetical protein